MFKSYKTAIILIFFLICIEKLEVCRSKMLGNNSKISTLPYFNYSLYLIFQRDIRNISCFEKNILLFISMLYVSL